jgi:hypothetical protein
MDQLLNGLNAENPDFSFLLFSTCKNWGEITFRLSNTIMYSTAEPFPEPV